MISQGPLQSTKFMTQVPNNYTDICKPPAIEEKTKHYTAFTLILFLPYVQDLNELFEEFKKLSS